MKTSKKTKFVRSTLWIFAALATQSALADGHTLRSNVEGLGSITVKGHTKAGAPKPGGSFTNIVASAFTTGGGLFNGDSGGVGAPYVKGATYTAGKFTSLGNFLTAEALTKVKVLKHTRKVLRWTADGTTISVTKNGFMGMGAEIGRATWLVIDPQVWHSEPGGRFDFVWVPGNSLDFILPDASTGLGGSLRTHGFVASSVPGFGDLFRWSIGVSSYNPGAMDIEFESNPLLGLNDAEIRADLMSRLDFDSDSGNYSIELAGFSVEAGFTVPDGIFDLEVSNGMGGEVDGSYSAVPEPSSGVVLGLSAIFIAAARKRRG